jgi:hypothetical protein
LIDLPLTKRSRLIRAIVSTTNIPPPPAPTPKRVSLHITAQRGSKFDADHPSTGVNLPRRNTIGHRLDIHGIPNSPFLTRMQPIYAILHGYTLVAKIGPSAETLGFTLSEVKTSA